MDLQTIREYKPDHAGTSMISLIIPPSANLSDLRQMMKKEYQTANNIKSNTNRKSVLSALTKLTETLKTLKMSDSGIALYAEQYI